KPHDESNTKVPEGSRNPNSTASSFNPPADQMETLTLESPIPTISSPILTACLNDSLEPSSEARLISKRVSNQEETPSLDNILSLTNRFEDILGVTTSSDEAIKVAADVSNMETTILASPTPTLRIHKDHPKNPSWVEAMKEELLQFKIQKVWTLFDCPKGVRPIGTKWVLKNKKDERGIVVRNKARLMNVKSAFLYGTIDEEVYVMQPPGFQDPAFPAKMDVKSAFLYGTIDEEVYAMQPPRFHDPVYPAKVYKVEKAMYGLHQAPRACHYGRASQDHKSTTGGSQFLCRRLISWQCKKQTIVATSKTEAEYIAAASCCRQVLWIQNQLLDYGRLISWQCKKQTIVATSTTEAKYVAAASCCRQVLWIQNQLLDYGYNFMEIPVISCKYWNG
nr:hypothetical protein [Tanacetum cinerariifolium]